MKLSFQTVCNPLRRGKNEGLAGLFEAKCWDGPRCWKDEDMEFIEKILEEDEYVHNGIEISQGLLEHLQIKLHADYIS